ncbi:MAG TPA: hypothetical protein VEA61_06355 [Allosphingosinicella sp.]|nr:hypothetical protein [Allosphingosinicella sp.]
MLVSVIAFAMLAGSDIAPPAKSAKGRRDPDRVVCKYDLEPGSRLARRKVCLTVAQWEEWRRNEYLNLLRHQYNGAP